MSAERRYSLQDVCHLLGVNNRQLHRFLEDAGIEPMDSARDARRKELDDSQVAQLRALLDDEMGDARRHELERRVAQLERRLAVLERGETPSVEVVPRAQRVTSSFGGLPEGWVSLSEACTRYGVNINTAKTHVQNNMLVCHKGLWKVGATRVAYALDPDEQLAFRAHFGVAS